MSNIDPNLLILFKIIWEERSSTRAAKRLFITQSAVSQALKRLRHFFQDDLFVRIPSGLAPTPRAIELSQKILMIAGHIEELSHNEKPFDPKTATSTFKIASTDYFERLTTPNLVQILLHEAPVARVSSTLLRGHLPKKDLQEGVVDCAVAGYFKEIPDGFYQKILFSDEFVGICRANHPYLKSKQNIDAYCKYPHLLVSISGDFEGVVDNSLPTKKNRHVCLTSPSFLSLPHVLLKSDTLFVLPKRLADLHARDFDLKMFRPPVKTPTIKIKMVWHERVHRNSFQKWMREALSKSL